MADLKKTIGLFLVRWFPTKKFGKPVPMKPLNSLLTSPLTFGSKTLPDGTYTLFTIPEKDEWTIIFNTDVDIWGAYRYDSKKDALRLNVKVKSTTEVVEAFAINFATLNENEAVLKLAWDQTKIEVPFSY